MATMYDCASQSSREAYEEVKKYYEEAYQCIDKALQYDESGQVQKAIDMYEFGLSLMDQALNMRLESPTQPDIEWEKTYSMIQKMRKSRKEVLGRISDAQSKQHPDAAMPPPSYEEALASSSTRSVPASMSPQQPYLPAANYVAVASPASLPQSNADEAGDSAAGETDTFQGLNEQLKDLGVTGNREILYSHNNVRLYFIAPDGRVSATSEPETLIIGRIEDLTHEDVLDETLLSIVEELSDTGRDDGHKKKRGHSHHSHHRRHHRHHDRGEASRAPTQEGQIYLQVGSWVYPLLPGISPVFRSEFGAFILPDVHSQTEGASVGLILPQNADKSVYDILDSILFGVVSEGQLHPQPPKRPNRSKRSDHADRKIESPFSRNVIKGANYLANNLIRGAGSASRFIDATTPRIMNRLNPAAAPQPVNPAVKTTVNVAKSVSGTAATISDFLATKVGSAATSLGQYLAPHIQQGGSKLLTATTKMNSEEASSKMDSVLGATSGAIQGIATVYGGLESAASILGRSLSNNTVQIIEYKYGKPVGQVTGDALATAGNVYDVHGNYKFLKPTKIAKVVAKTAIRTSHEEFTGSGPGDGSGFRSVLNNEGIEGTPPLSSPPASHTALSPVVPPLSPASHNAQSPTPGASSLYPQLQDFHNTPPTDVQLLTKK